MIPKSRPVNFNDVMDLREFLGLTRVGDVPTIFGWMIPNQKWIALRKEHDAPVYPQVAFITRWLEMHPEHSWMPEWPTPINAFEHLKKLDPDINYRRFAFLMGLEESSGVRMLSPKTSSKFGHNNTQSINQRLLYIFMQMQTAKELHEFEEEVVRREAILRGLSGKNNSWNGVNRPTKRITEAATRKAKKEVADAKSADQVTPKIE